MRDLNVGFIKTGLGTLKFAGINSYEGATIIRGGELELLGGSKLSKSRVYVEKGGLLSGTGVIESNLYNSGVVRPGAESIGELKVGGRYTQEGAHSALELNFNTQGNSKLIAQSYDIKGGKLLYRPISEFYAGGVKVKIDLGDLGNHIDGFSSV